MGLLFYTWAKDPLCPIGLLYLYVQVSLAGLWVDRTTNIRELSPTIELQFLNIYKYLSQPRATATAFAVPASICVRLCVDKTAHDRKKSTLLDWIVRVIYVPEKEIGWQ